MIDTDIEQQTELSLLLALHKKRFCEPSLSARERRYHATAYKEVWLEIQITPLIRSERQIFCLYMNRLHEARFSVPRNWEPVCPLMKCRHGKNVIEDTSRMRRGK